MPNEQLDNLVKVDSLKAEAPDAIEIEGLVASGTARLRDAHRVELSTDSRFDLAYNAAFALALAALRWHGYRPANRYIVFQSLAHTVNMAAAKWRVLAAAHKKRNEVEYGGKADVSDATVEDLVRIVDDLAQAIEQLGPPTIK